jgi:tartrate-resistant acid phosphatase type 5
VFKSEILEKTPWFFVMGNHDHRGNATAQITYTNKSQRWILPSYNYTINVHLSDHPPTTTTSSPLISFLMVDTVVLCGNDDGNDHAQPKLKTLAERLRSAQYFASIESRLKSMSESDVPYLIVTGHFPVWSAGQSGPNKCLIDKLRPMLHKYKVSAYLCGHDHNLQHIRDEYMDHMVEYVITGATNTVDANATQHINDVPADSLKFYWPHQHDFFIGGMNVVKASAESMQILYVDTAGKELYNFVIYPRQSAHKKRP